ncbi:glycerol-3-phosphate acyltransferase PlsY [Bacilli bacterium PM5-3]|nr:glycerol-3-phosphate acyltransferase PlsY [Bacilli bacterium PM5-3]MDH6603353.1 glycerol-3-phosphate acyltransferase PlsY [Bacilli bacterium PM5-9]
MEIINYLLIIILGYLIGSIPFALIIGKLFYNQDIRKSGSGNLGGTNAGRTLGKKAGAAVMILDITKAFIAISLATIIINHFEMNVNPNFCGLAVVFGHCYPIFAGFKGGKGVACAAGFILAINPILLLLAVVILVINLKIHHMMSLAVLVTLLVVTTMAFTIPYFDNTKYVLSILTVFLFFQHRDNIKRILNGTENKISWL